MRAVKGSGGKSTERKLRAALVRLGMRNWRMNPADVLGHPDFVFEEQNVAVFVDGCFWHGCVRCYRRPHSSQEYWDRKVARNKARDRKNRAALRRRGWAVVRIWEHEVAESPARCANKIASQLKGTKRSSALASELEMQNPVFHP